MLFSSRNRQPRANRRSPTPSGGQNLPPRNENPGIPSRSPSPGSSGTKPLYLCSPFADAALVKGNFKTIVMLPKYTDIMEWVAVNSAFLFLLFYFGSFLLLLIDLPSSWTSVRLLYELERVLWCHCRDVYPTYMSDDVCWQFVSPYYLLFYQAEFFENINWFLW